MFFSSAGDRKAGGGNRTRMASLEGCTLPVTNSIGNKDLENSKYQGMPQSMPCGRENDTKPEVSSVDDPSPDIAALADLLTTLPTSDRAKLLADMPLEQRRQIAQLLAKRIMEDSTHE